MLTPLSGVNQVSHVPLASGALPVQQELDAPVPADQTALSGLQPAKKQSMVVIPAEHLTAQANATTAALLPGLEALTTGGPTAANGLNLLAEIGWRFFRKDQEVGLIGAGSGEGIEARRGDATLELSSDILQSAAAYYGEHPGMARLERDGAQFFDAFHRPQPAFDKERPNHVGLVGEPYKCSVPLVSSDEGEIRQALADYRTLRQVNSRPLATWYCLQEATPEKRLGVLQRMTDLTPEQLALQLDPEQAARAAKRILNDADVPFEDRREVGAALIGRLQDSPVARLVSSIQGQLMIQSAVPLLKSVFGQSEHPPAMLKSLLNTLVAGDYTPEVCQALLDWSRNVPEPFPGQALAEQLIPQMKDGGARGAVLHTLFIPSDSSPEDVWKTFKDGLLGNFSHLAQDDRARMAAICVARVAGEGARMAEKIAEGPSSERAYLILDTAFSLPDPMTGKDWLKLAAMVASDPDKLEPVLQKAAQDDQTSPVVEAIRSVSSQIEDSKIKHEAIRLLCGSNPSQLSRAGASLLDCLGNMRKHGERELKAAELFLAYLDPASVTLARELMAESPTTTLKLWALQAVLGNPGDPLKAGAAFAGRGVFGENPPLEPIWARLPDLRPQQTSPHAELQGALALAILKQPELSAPDAGLKLLARVHAEALHKDQEPFQAAYTALCQQVAGDDKMVQWLSGCGSGAALGPAFASLVANEDMPGLLRARDALMKLPDQARAAAAASFLRTAEFRQDYNQESHRAFDQLAERLEAGQIPSDKVGAEMGSLENWTKDTASVSHMAGGAASMGVGRRGSNLVIGGMRVKSRT